MRHLILLFSIITCLCINSHAQIGGLFNKAKNKIQQRVDRKVDSEIDKTFDKAEGKKTPGDGTITGDTATTKPDGNGLKSFSKYDFIPGDSILYAEDFQQESIGELPANWNTSGSGEVITLDRFPGQWLRLHKSFTYLTANQKTFGENYTLEFDLILQLKNNGWMYPEIKAGFFASGDDVNSGNGFLKDHSQNADVVTTLFPGEFKSSRATLKSSLTGKNYFSSDPKAYDALEQSYGRPVHIAIQVQKERMRMWVNGDKLFDAPKAVPAGQVMNQLFFEVGATNYSEEQYGVFVSNVKIATGKPDTRHKLVEEGRFSTTGILFDFQSAEIRPESYGVIKEIAAVLKENAGIRVTVIGHTSSDGDDKANMELSKKRAAAVKSLLATEFGIDDARVETEGKGETQPIADNKTKEGKAANRRVEFVKL